jgi:hypothetical protein
VNLRDLLTVASGELEDAEATTDPGGATTWSRGGQAFAVLGADGAVAEFALDPSVAAAATRTPDVTASARGRGWVSFRPVSLDDHGRDRARAWFESAHRRIATG